MKDIVAANTHFAVNPAFTGVDNIAYGQRMTVNDLVPMILKSANSDAPIQYRPEREGDVKHSLAAINRLRETGFSPAGSLEEGLQLTVRSWPGEISYVH